MQPLSLRDKIPCCREESDVPISLPFCFMFRIKMFSVACFPQFLVVIVDTTFLQSGLLWSLKAFFFFPYQFHIKVASLFPCQPSQSTKDSPKQAVTHQNLIVYSCYLPTSFKKYPQHTHRPQTHSSVFTNG